MTAMTYERLARTHPLVVTEDADYVTVVSIDPARVLAVVFTLAERLRGMCAIVFDDGEVIRPVIGDAFVIADRIQGLRSRG